MLYLLSTTPEGRFPMGIVALVLVVFIVALLFLELILDLSD